MPVNRRQLIKGAAVGGGGLVVGGVIGKSASGGEEEPGVSGLPGNAMAVAKERGLKPADIVAALKTYCPSGMHDTHYMFASGGHSGQIWVYGLPSMRILKVIPVFGSSPYQGYGYSDETREVLGNGFIGGKPITFGDTHHPALSETHGDYDGEFLFINDKAGGRVAVIDLRDFATKQIIKNPLTITDHGGPFVTPNTEYMVENSQYSAPLGWKYAPLKDYKKSYRGVATFWKFDRKKGRIDEAASWAMELPPYFQDLADAGKGESDGWCFVNSFNTEMATGAGLNRRGKPMEVGASQRDMDYMHVINWRAAEKIVRRGMAEEVNGMKLIRMDMAVKHGLLFLIPEPKSPHGVDVTPKGDYIVVSGKLDPHVTIYSFKKIKAAIAKGRFKRDPFGLPIIDFNAAMEAQVEVGLGPLHCQFDDQGYAYTALFLANQVARWTLGPPYRDDGWKLVGNVPVRYNTGHIAAVGGDTTKPGGKFLVALNKWSVDRFVSTGPHHTPNLQLVDISRPDGMQVLYDAPCPDGEPHYAQILSVDRLKPWPVYPNGWNAGTQSKDPNATKPRKEKIVRRGDTVEIWATATRTYFAPDEITVREGDKVIWHITSPERTQNASHGLILAGYNISTIIDPGQTLTVSFVADKAGTFPFYCPEFCSALHMEMMGYFLVQPASAN